MTLKEMPGKIYQVLTKQEIYHPCAFLGKDFCMFLVVKTIALVIVLKLKILVQ